MKNNRGFVLLETLIVSVFTIIIFTFMYRSIIPLIGIYEGKVADNNVDMTYNLYHLRKDIYNDSDYHTVFTSNDYGYVLEVTFNDASRWYDLVKLLGIDYDNYKLMFITNFNAIKSTIISDSEVDSKIKEYISDKKNTFYDNNIILLDNERCIHLKLDY